MVVGEFHARFEPDLYMQYMAIVGRGNVTKSFRDHMRQTIAVSKNDTSQIDAQILQNDIDKITKDLLKIQTDLRQKQALMENYEKSKIEKETEQLEKIKLDIEKANNCIMCNNLITSKIFKFEEGNVCKECYMVGRVPLK